MNTITTLPTTLKNKAQALISTMSLPKTYKAAVFEKANAPFVIKDVELTQPSANEVLVKVIACGVCHSDAVVQSGGFGNGFPIVPGHEVIGTVAAVGEGVQKWKVGERVGGPWHGGHDGTCKQCNRGQFQMCSNGAVNGVTRDGGYAEYVHLRSEAVVRIPEDVDPYEYAQFSAPYAAKMGYKVVAISGGDKKRDFAHKLGAHEYIDTSKDDPVKKLTEMGGAALIVCTAPNPKSISPLTGGLGAGGKLLILAPCGGVEINSIDLITKMASVSGFPSGHALDCEEAIEFTKLHTVDCMIEKFPLSDVQKAYDHMLSGDVRFRSVLVMDQ
ncbi:alcohol dehydrogenase [Botrytis cinerea]